MAKSALLVQLVLAMILGCCVAAPKFHSRNKLIAMENEQVLDPNNNFILRWTVVNSTGEIQIEMQANCTGWLGIGYGYDEIGTVGSLGDIMMGGYDDVTGQGYIEDRNIGLLYPRPGGGKVDQSQDLQVLSATYNDPWTVIRISRKIDTRDPEDVAFVPGPALVFWTRAKYDDMSIPHEPHDNGAANVTFIPYP